ncbi:hypothetical protein E2C01_069499 [Portunus trituberculatus]|uniref:Uncharacterized protein n=1 Tax=Portunus trituberculatus TaxID=210409 RepID=A0A5B7I2Z3_PORTR|nr:hypothetical protein [Portunus trituberculatus]
MRLTLNAQVWKVMARNNKATEHPLSFPETVMSRDQTRELQGERRAEVNSKMTRRTATVFTVLPLCLALSLIC